MQTIPKLITFKSSDKDTAEEVSQEEPPKEEGPEEIFENRNEPEPEIDEIILIPHRVRQILAHHEILEEIPESEVEYEQQRDMRDDCLEEIIEEEEDVDEIEEEEEDINPDDMEIIEGEEVGEEAVADEDFWGDREDDYVPRRSLSLGADSDDDWEYTNGQGGSLYRYGR